MKKQFIQAQLRILMMSNQVIATSGNNLNNPGGGGPGTTEAPARVVYPHTINGALGKVADQK